MKLAFVVSLMFCSVLLVSTEAPFKAIVEKLETFIIDGTEFVHLLDGSETVTPKGFKKSRRAAKWLTRAADHLAPIGDDQLQVGLIEFHNNAAIKFDLGQFDNLQYVIQAIKDVTFDNGSNTDFYNGLLVAWFMFMYNTYPENHKVIWLVSNGGHTAGPDPVPLATNIKQLGIKICVAAIKEGPVDLTLLQAIASNNCYLEFNTYDQYLKRVKKAADKIINS